MTSGSVNFWDADVWSLVSTLTLLLVAMLVANMLRRSIRPLRRLMIPNAVLGGFLLLLAEGIYKACTGNAFVHKNLLELLTYHGLGLGFVAMSLRTLEKQGGGAAGTGIFDSGVTVVATYLLQCVLGLAVSMLLYRLMGGFWASGMLLPMGYGQGPGQAYNWGHNYEVAYGFESGTSFGLTVAAMGFVAASVGGVIYLNKMRRAGEFAGKTGEAAPDENLSAETITGHNEIPLSEAMDKLTVQVALVFVAYSMAYLFMYGVDTVIETGALGNFGFNTLRPLLWGFNFLIGTLFAMGLKAVLRLLRRKNIVHREYANNFMQSRIAGFMFDIMVVASIAAIDLSAFRKPDFLVPLTLICVLGGVASYFYLDVVCRRVFPAYRHEAFLSLYGMLTGTASTGVILLREADPRYETPAANNLVYQQPWAIVFGFPMLLLLSVAPQSPGKSLLTLLAVTALFAAMNVLLFRRDVFRRRRAKKAARG